MGYSNNEKNENNGFSYNLMLKNIPYHIKGGLNRTPIMPAHPRTNLYRKYPGGDAEQHTNGTAGEYWLHLRQDYPAQTHAETWVHLQEKPDELEATDGGDDVISRIQYLRKIRHKPMMFDQTSDSDIARETEGVNLLYGILRDYKLNIYDYENKN